MGGIDLETAIGPLESPGDLDLVVDQIFMSHDAAFGTNLGDDGVGNFALIKRVGTSFGDEPESPRKIGIPDWITLLEKDPIRCEYRRPVGMLQKQRMIDWPLQAKLD